MRTTPPATNAKLSQSTPLPERRSSTQAKVASKCQTEMTRPIQVLRPLSVCQRTAAASNPSPGPVNEARQKRCNGEFCTSHLCPPAARRFSSMTPQRNGALPPKSPSLVLLLSIQVLIAKKCRLQHLSKTHKIIPKRCVGECFDQTSQRTIPRILRGGPHAQNSARAPKSAMQPQCDSLGAASTG